MLLVILPVAAELRAACVAVGTCDTPPSRIGGGLDRGPCRSASRPRRCRRPCARSGRDRAPCRVAIGLRNARHQATPGHDMGRHFDLDLEPVAMPMWPKPFTRVGGAIGIPHPRDT